jgi:GTPase-associated protein 1, N-terminal domain type 2
VLVQQAIFASGPRRQREGFHLVSRTSGLTKSDANLLLRRLPWCDALSPADRPATGTCYWQLDDESFCISRSMRLSEKHADGQPREHNAPQLLTHCLVVPRGVFAQFADNPFAVVSAVGAAGYLLSHEPAGGKLQPIRLAGRTPAVDHILLGNLAREFGPAVVAALVHEAIEHERLIVVGPQGESLVAGLMSVLPVELRRDFSFSIGLRPSLRRPVRIVAVPELSLQIERFARQCRYHLLNASELSEVDCAGDPWAALVQRTIDQADFRRLAGEVVSPTRSVAGYERSETQDGYACSASDLAFDESEGSSFQSQTAVATAPMRRAQVHHDLVREDSQAREMLEHLDDLVYDAIAGREGAFEELTGFWPEVLAEVEGEALVESREQYIRFALGLWNQGDSDGIQDPQRAMAALDVLCLLFPEGEF